MVDVKLSDVIASDPLDGTELVYVVQGGLSRRTTAQDVADLATGGAGTPGGTSGQYQYNNGGAFAGIGLILTADTTFYVRTDGNDANTGLANTSGGAWETIQHAVDYMAGVDANGYGVTIQVADGTYNPASPGSYCVSILYRPKSANYFYILGNPTTPGNVVIDGLGGFPYGFSIGYNYDTGALSSVRVDRLDGFKVKDAYSFATAYGRSSAGINNVETENNSFVLEAYDYSRVNMNYVAFSGTSDYAVYMDGYASGGFNNLTFAASSAINYEVFYLTAYNYLTAILNNYTNLTATTDYYVGPFCFLETSGTSGSIPGAAGTVDALGKVA